MKAPTASLRLIRPLTALLLALLPATVQAQFGFTTNGGTITLTGYAGTNAVVVVPDWTNGYPVTKLGSTTFTARTNLTSVTIGTNVTSLGVRLLYKSFAMTALTVHTNNPAFSSVDGVLSRVPGQRPQRGGAVV